MSSDFEEDINDSQDLWNRKNENLNEIKEQFGSFKESLAGLKKLGLDNDDPVIALAEQCIARLDVFIAERSKMLDGHKKCLDVSRKCLIEIKASKNPH